MIVKMNKILLLCQAERRAAALKALRALGVLHLVPVREAKSEDTDQARNEARACERAIRVLEQQAALDASSYGSDKSDKSDRSDLSDKPPKTPKAMIRETLALDDERKTLEDRRAALAQEWRPWEDLGDFDPQAVRALAERGVTLRLYRSREPQPPAAPDGFHLFPLVWGPKGGAYALVGDGEAETPPESEPLPLPTRSLSETRQEAEEIGRRLDEIGERLRALAAQRTALDAALPQFRDAARFAEAQAGMDAQGPLAWLRGYCPADQADAIRRAAAKEGWGLLIEEPDENDAPPTQIRHPFWVKPIQSVLDMIGILPGYREVDISAVFLLFFSVFFAMIVGDAGYGMIFLALSFFARKKMTAAPKEPFRLLYILSASTIVWGLMTGNIFGIRAFPALLQPLRIGWLSNIENIMLLCFLLGAIHLTIAHGWNVLRMIKTPQALAHAGWIAITWVMFFAARTMILNQEFPAFVYALLGVGLLAVILFMTPPKLLKTEWTSHVMLPLTVIGNFVDVVSYVRLFAVGSASLAVAQAFNDMAVGGEMSVLRGLGAALILFAGHALNIVLCGLGVLVHGVRLNTLEFSGHIGMQWTGEPYRPFAAEILEPEQSNIKNDEAGDGLKRPA